MRRKAFQKVLAIAAAAVMAVGTLAGCGSSETAESTAAAEAPAEEAATEAAEGETEAAAEAAEGETEAAAGKHLRRT